jgi:hypothetical protein
MFRLIELFFFFYLGYVLLKNLVGLFIAPKKPGNFAGQQQNTTYKKEGKIHVDHIPEKKSSSHEDDGEYIPYKEIKE